MRNKWIFTVLWFSLSTMLCTPVFALDSDLIYGYETKNKEEFVITGKSGVNIGGQIPDYLRDIYDITPQSVYTSDYGANVVTPNAPIATSITYAPPNAPVPSYMASPTGFISGATQGAGQSSNYTASISNGGYVGGNMATGNAASGKVTSSNTSGNQYPDNYHGSYEDENDKKYPLTSIEKVRNEDGSIGVLRIPEIDLKVTAYDGDTFAAMKKGIGHISSTSAWSGNIGLVGVRPDRTLLKVV